MKKETTGILTGIAVTGGIYLYDKITGKNVLGTVREKISSLFGSEAKEQIIRFDDGQINYLYNQIDDIKTNIIKVQSEVYDVNKYLVDDNTYKQMEENHLVTTKQLEDIKAAIDELKKIKENN